ncbi:unnamed protein product [Bursaphelenchus xylophilus]|uniref:(pine wood nematode) hypothetical protein n=1 Tax=Bursaphelenchus xylophilus TaxID=6326 RepID=A0A1I7S5M1_BURXY|nr:unnamed protein product [Bursaphelenchus xylophilus]CAG9124860.1 unnamed protein product [Bursaphelenchus xylophilus]
MGSENRISATDLFRVDFTQWKPNLVEPPAVRVNAPMRWNNRRQQIGNNGHKVNKGSKYSQPPTNPQFRANGGCIPNQKQNRRRNVYTLLPQQQQKRLQQQNKSYNAALEQQKQLAHMLSGQSIDANAGFNDGSSQGFSNFSTNRTSQTNQGFGAEAAHSSQQENAEDGQFAEYYNNPYYSNSRSDLTVFRRRQPKKANALAPVETYRGQTNKRNARTQRYQWATQEPVESRPEPERIFCYSVRYFERITGEETDSEFTTRDVFGRLFKVHYIGYDENPLPTESVPKKKKSDEERLKDEHLDCIDNYDIDFGDEIVDIRERNRYEVRSKFDDDKNRVLQFLYNYTNGPMDVANLRRIRMLVMSMQMYDDVDGLVMPAEVAMAEFNLQNGVMDYYDSLIDPLHWLNSAQKQRLATTALNGFSLERSSADRELYNKPLMALYEIIRRLHPIDALIRGEPTPPYFEGFTEFVRSPFPNLNTDPEAWGSQRISRSGECPLLVGEWGRRWIVVLDHEYENVIQGVQEMTKALDSDEDFELEPERFVLASAFFEAMAVFMEAKGDERIMEQLHLYGTPEAEGKPLGTVTKPLCSFHSSISNYRCARNSVLGICYSMENYFRSHFGNEFLPEKEIRNQNYEDVEAAENALYHPPDDGDDYE